MSGPTTGQIIIVIIPVVMLSGWFLTVPVRVDFGEKIVGKS